MKLDEKEESRCKYSYFVGFGLILLCSSHLIHPGMTPLKFPIINCLFLTQALSGALW